MPIWVIAAILATVGAVLLLTPVLWRINAPADPRRRSDSRDGGVTFAADGGGGRSGRGDRDDGHDAAGSDGDGGGGGGD